jgi:hypothetical protein
LAIHDQAQQQLQKDPQQQQQEQEEQLQKERGQEQVTPASQQEAAVSNVQEEENTHKTSWVEESQYLDDLEGRLGMLQMEDGPQVCLAGERLFKLRQWLQPQKLLQLVEREPRILEDLQLYLGLKDPSEAQPGQHTWHWLNLPQRSLEKQQELEEMGKQLGMDWLPEGAAQQFAMQRLQLEVEICKPYHPVARLLGRANQGAAFLQKVQMELGIIGIPWLNPQEHAGLKLEWQTVPFPSSRGGAVVCAAGGAAAVYSGSSNGMILDPSAGSGADEPLAKRQRHEKDAPAAAATGGAGPPERCGASAAAGRGDLLHLEVVDWLGRRLFVRMASTTRLGVLFRDFYRISGYDPSEEVLRWFYEVIRLLPSDRPRDYGVKDGERLEASLAQCGD